MKNLQLLFLLVLAAAPAIARAQASSDTAAIDALVAEEVAAWNKADAKAYSARFAEDGSFTNVFGQVFYGRAGFEQRHADLFQGAGKGSTLKLAVAKTRFVRPDVAVVDLDAELSGAAMPPSMPVGKDGVLRTKLMLVLTKDKGAWWMTGYHNVAVTPLPAHP